MKKSRGMERGWSLIEVMFVLFIIAVLGEMISLALPFIEGKVRDNRRLNDLSTMQRIVEVYWADQGQYPNTGGNWVVSDAANVGDFAISPTVNSVYIPSITPTYYEQLPWDPLPGPSTVSFCAPLGYNRAWAYISDGSHFKIVYHCASETNDYDPGNTYYDPGRPLWAWAASDNMEYTTNTLGW